MLWEPILFVSCSVKVEVLHLHPTLHVLSLARMEDVSRPMYWNPTCNYYRDSKFTVHSDSDLDFSAKASWFFMVTSLAYQKDWSLSRLVYQFAQLYSVIKGHLSLSATKYYYSLIALEQFKLMGAQVLLSLAHNYGHMAKGDFRIIDKELLYQATCCFDQAYRKSQTFRCA